jgi:hypothetical protein
VLLSNLKNRSDTTDSLEMTRRIHACSDTLSVRWLTILPKSKAYEIRDDDFVVCTRFRLGIPCFDDLPERCPRCLQTAGVDHAQVCNRMPYDSDRHDFFKKALESLLKPLGVVRDEPKFGRGKQRADIRFDSYNVSAFLDVTFVFQLAASNMRFKYPLKHRYDDKMHKYVEATQLHVRGTDFIPIVVCPFGETHDSLFKFLGDIAGAAEQSGYYHSKNAFLSVARDRLAVAIQKGNAIMLQYSAQAMRSSLYASESLA